MIKNEERNHFFFPIFYAILLFGAVWLKIWAFMHILFKIFIYGGLFNEYYYKRERTYRGSAR